MLDASGDSKGLAFVRVAVKLRKLVNETKLGKSVYVAAARSSPARAEGNS